MLILVNQCDFLSIHFESSWEAEGQRFGYVYDIGNPFVSLMKSRVHAVVVMFTIEIIEIDGFGYIHFVYRISRSDRSISDQATNWTCICVPSMFECVYVEDYKWQHIPYFDMYPSLSLYRSVDVCHFNCDE